MLLSALFSSSCYWEPVPTERLLQRNLALLAPAGNATHPEPDPYNVRHDIGLLVEAVEAYHNQTAALAENATLAKASPNMSYPDAAISHFKFANTGIPLTRMYERCWCDFTPLLYWSDNVLRRWSATNETVGLFRSFSFFDPYNEVGWEAASLIRHAKELSAARPKPESPDATTTVTTVTAELTPAVPSDSTPAVIAEAAPRTAPVGYLKRAHAGVEHTRSRVKAFGERYIRWKTTENGSPDTGKVRDTEQEHVVKVDSAPPLPETPSPPLSLPKEPPPPQEPPMPDFPIPFSGLILRLWRAVVHFLSQTYDLTPFGIPVIVDFGWSRA